MMNGETAPLASDLATALRGQTQQLMDALAAGDRSPWHRFIAEDVVFLTEDGTRKSKADLVAEIRAFPPEIWGRIRVTDYVVVGNDRVAVATCGGPALDEVKTRYRSRCLTCCSCRVNRVYEKSSSAIRQDG